MEERTSQVNLDFTIGDRMGSYVKIIWSDGSWFLADQKLALVLAELKWRRLSEEKPSKKKVPVKRKRKR